MTITAMLAKMCWRKRIRVLIGVMVLVTTVLYLTGDSYVGDSQPVPGYPPLDAPITLTRDRPGGHSVLRDQSGLARPWMEKADAYGADGWSCFGGGQRQSEVPPGCAWIEASPIRGSPGLGNQMFIYASILGIAQRLNATPVWPRQSPLRHAFQLSAPFSDVINVQDGPTTMKRRENKSCAFDVRVNDLPRNVNLKMEGFLQSWKYFDHVKDVIRKEFTFSANLAKQAREYVRGQIKKEHGSHTKTRDVVTIGIHIRRGNMVDLAGIGYSVASIPYFRRAIHQFTSALAVNQKRLFIMVSEPLAELDKWLKRAMQGMNFPVVRTSHADPALDLAILSLCNHTVQTVGTFGWWGAWLADGNATYFRHFPRENSFLARLFNKEDYFLPQWTDIG